MDGQTVTNELRLEVGGTKEVTYSRTKAIKMFCTECLGFETHPKECISKNCALYPFRDNDVELKDTKFNRSTTEEKIAIRAKRKKWGNKMTLLRHQTPLVNA